MKYFLHFLFVTLLLASVSLSARGYNPRIVTDCRTDGDNSSSGITGDNSTKFPVGLPFTDVNSGGVPDNSSYRDSNIVYSFELTEDIGPASLYQTRAALEQARQMHAACVLIRINSYTGAIDAAQNIRDELLAYDRPVIIYVEDKAISAAALISMAGDSLYVHKGGNIGQGTIAAKKQSKAAGPALKKEVSKNSTSCYRETDEMPCIMNSADAVKKHFAQAETNNIDEALSRAGFNEYKVVYYTPGIYERLIDWFMQPILSLVLVSLLAFGIRLQRKQAFPGPVTFLLLVSLALFFVPLYQGGLANGLEIASGILVIGISALTNKTHRIIRYLPLLLILLLTLCQLGAMHTLPIPDMFVKLGLTIGAFATGWMVPWFFGRLRFRTTRITQPELPVLATA